MDAHGELAKTARGLNTPAAVAMETTPALLRVVHMVMGP